MALQFSTAIRNAMLNTMRDTTGTTPKLNVYSGSIPQDTAAGATGTLLAQLNAYDSNSAFLGSAANGSISKGAWPYTQAIAQGTAGYFRITNSGGTTCHMQGTITLTGGGGDMTFDDITLEVGQPIVITGFTVNAGGA